MNYLYIFVIRAVIARSLGNADFDKSFVLLVRWGKAGQTTLCIVNLSIGVRVVELTFFSTGQQARNSSLFVQFPGFGRIKPLSERSSHD